MQKTTNFSDRLEEILTQQLELDKKNLTLQANLKSDLNLDEVDRADLLSSLENELHFYVEDKRKLNDLETVEDLIRLVEENSHEF